MSDQIRVGDLVMLKGACCSRVSAHIGMYGIVAAVALDPAALCPSCGYKYGRASQARVPDLAVHGGNSGWFPTSWLRKIPPFPELADEKKDDRIPEYILK